jgi:hypothetical protein
MTGFEQSAARKVALHGENFPTASNEPPPLGGGDIPVPAHDSPRAFQKNASLAPSVTPCGRKPKQTIIAVMRRLLHQIYGILKSGLPYKPEKRGFAGS